MKRYQTIWSAPLAFWGGHRTGPNRVSLPVPTHASAVGMLRAILGKTRMAWRVHRTSILRLDGIYPMSLKEMNNFPERVFFIDDSKVRTVRTYALLCNVEYNIEASIEALEDPSELTKFENMFERRIAKGQVYGTYPTMGPKEYMVSSFRLAQPDEVFHPMPINQDLGLQPFDQDFRTKGYPWYYAPMQILEGTVDYPNWDQVKSFGLKRDLGGSL